MSVDLARTHAGGYRPGRPYFVRAAWLVVEALVFSNPVVVSYRAKRSILRWFGADVADNVLIKPGVKVKYPWRLSIGENSWIGERVWIDNMEDVSLGANVVVSQGTCIVTGNHDWADPGMPLSPQPTRVEDGAWIGAFARVGPGLTIGARSIVALGSVALSDTEPDGIYKGNPATRVGTRTIEGR